MTANGDSVTKHAAPIPAHLSERMKVGRMLEVLEQLHFDSHNQGKVVLDRVARNFLVASASHAAADPDLTVHYLMARRGPIRR
jgi:hypothetical protein